MFNILKNNRGFVVSGTLAAAIGAGALAGGGTAWWKKRQADKMKTERFTGAGPADIGKFPGYSALRQLSSSIGAPETYRDKYYQDLYTPTANQARSQWEQYVKPQIMDESLIPRSTQTADLLRRSAGERELELARYGGELRSRGLDRGYSQQGRKISLEQDLLGREITQQGAQDRFEQGQFQDVRQQDVARREYERGILPSALQAGGSAFNAFGGSQALQQLLQGQGGGAVSPTGYQGEDFGLKTSPYYKKLRR